MFKKYRYLFLVLVPSVLLFIAVCVLSAQIRFGKEVIIRITGYDPMSLLSGHYIRYQIDWKSTDCTQFDNNICPKEDFMRVLNNGTWGKSGRFYVTEDVAYVLDRAVRSPHNTAEIVYSYHKGRRPYALRLLINGESFEGADKIRSSQKKGKHLSRYVENKTLDQIAVISTNITTLYSLQRNFDGLNNNIAIVTGIVPSDMYNADKNDDVITTALGGKAEIYAVNLSDQNDGFAITFKGVSDAACAYLQTQEWEVLTPNFVKLQIKKGDAAADCRDCGKNECSVSLLYQPDYTKK